jgi:hypothetical protein
MMSSSPFAFCSRLCALARSFKAIVACGVNSLKGICQTCRNRLLHLLFLLLLIARLNDANLRLSGGGLLLFLVGYGVSNFAIITPDRLHL